MSRGTQQQECGWDVEESKLELGTGHLHLSGSQRYSILLPLSTQAFLFSPVHVLGRDHPTATEVALSQAHFQSSWGKAQCGLVDTHL